MVITPVVAFYLLRDWDRLTAKVDTLLPRPYAKTIRDLVGEVDASLASFIRGQGMVCVILGVFYAIALTVVGLNFGLLVGLGAGLVSFIPYVGSIAGFVVATGIAVFQFDDLDHVAGGRRGVHGRPGGRGQFPDAEAGRRVGRAASGLGSCSPCWRVVRCSASPVSCWRFRWRPSSAS